jgi:hypothetical protein
MVHPTGVRQSSNISWKRRLTGTLSLTGNCRDKSLMANPVGASDEPKIEAPELVATGSSARASMTAEITAQSKRIALDSAIVVRPFAQLAGGVA